MEVLDVAVENGVVHYINYSSSDCSSFVLSSSVSLKFSKWVWKCKDSSLTIFSNSIVSSDSSSFSSFVMLMVTPFLTADLFWRIWLSSLGHFVMKFRNQLINDSQKKIIHPLCIYWWIIHRNLSKRWPCHFSWCKEVCLNIFITLWWQFSRSKRSSP